MKLPSWRQIRALLGFNCEFYEECEKADKSNGVCRISGGKDCCYGVWSIKKASRSFDSKDNKTGEL